MLLNLLPRFLLRSSVPRRRNLIDKQLASKAQEYFRGRIAESKIRIFGTPYILIDDIFTSEIIEKIHQYWPDKNEFRPEIQGMNIRKYFSNTYGDLSVDKNRFWQEFNETIWFELMASLGWPLTRTKWSH
jgi:hypothetical protein